MACYKFKNPSVTQLTEPVTIGAKPVWDSRVGKLFFVDIHAGRVMGYDYATQTMDIAAEFPGSDIAPVIPTTTKNVMLAGINRDLARINLYDKGAKPEVLHTVQDDKPKNRFNEGKADSKGRVWIGTVGHEPKDGGPLDANAAALFKFTKGNLKNPSVMIPNVSISNGLTWSLDGTKFYYIDTFVNELAQYDYDAEAGTISNRTLILDAKNKAIGNLDGVEIDVDGNLWITVYNGGSLLHFSTKTNTIMRRIPIPAQYTTSVTWGGPKLDILFVLTSRRGMTPEQIAQQPGSGCLYAVTNLGTKGREPFYADI